MKLIIVNINYFVTISFALLLHSLAEKKQLLLKILSYLTSFLCNTAFVHCPFD